MSQQEVILRLLWFCAEQGHGQAARQAEGALDLIGEHGGHVGAQVLGDTVPAQVQLLQAPGGGRARNGMGAWAWREGRGGRVVIILQFKLLLPLLLLLLMMMMMPTW